MPKSIAQMESELIYAGWKPHLSEQPDVWRAPSGQLYTGVEYSWQIMMGDKWSKEFHRSKS